MSPIQEVSHNDIHRAIGSLEAKVDDATETLKGLDERTRDLETFKSKVLGAVVATGVISSLFSFILELIFRK